MITLSITTFLVTILNVGVLFFVLRRILFKPVTKFMENRTKKIEDAIAQTEKDKTQAKQLLQQYEEQLRQAENEAEKIIRAAREAGQQEANGLITEAKGQADIIIANGRRQIEAEQRAAMAVFKTEAAALVVAASSRLLQRELNQEDNRRLAGLILNEIGNR